MQRDKATVPVYGLYGEQLISSDPGFVHIEDIADRSSDLGWLIKPHRHSKLFQVLCIFDGQLEVELNRKPHALSGSWIVTIPAGVVHGFRFQPNSNGFVLSIASSVIPQSKEEEYSRHIEELYIAPQLIPLTADAAGGVQAPANHGAGRNESIKENPARESSGHASSGDSIAENGHAATPGPGNGWPQNPFLHYVQLIRQEFENFNADREQALALLSKLALLALSRQLQQNRIETGSGHKDSLLLSRFRALVEEHYRAHWSVTQYTQALHVSPSTLSRACHEYFAESPKSIIQQRLLGEAKRRLVYTRQSNEEIAYTLGFKDHAYFARFFKKLEGTTPGEYRKRADAFHD
ncbi:MAG: helix-turn-helix domain-containing protein [Gammaproteobacteria bacterium]|nr:helix-turn-helix domain-containing protein [Gammaproteobacteria bacterium]